MQRCHNAASCTSAVNNSGIGGISSRDSGRSDSSSLSGNFSINSRYMTWIWFLIYMLTTPLTKTKQALAFDDNMFSEILLQPMVWWVLPMYDCLLSSHQLTSSHLRRGSHMTSTKCGHIFCKACLKQSIAAQGKCPTCRKKMTMRNTFRVYLPATRLN